MGGIDVVIDDGSHVSADQIATFETLYPLLDKDGVYLCEDTHCCYWTEFQAGYREPGSFIEYAKGLVDRMHAWYIDDPRADRTEEFARMTLGISFYDSMVVVEKRDKGEPFHCQVGARTLPLRS
jgi:hypothetical protein